MVIVSLAHPSNQRGGKTGFNDDGICSVGYSLHSCGGGGGVWIVHEGFDKSWVSSLWLFGGR